MNNLTFEEVTALYGLSPEILYALLRQKKLKGILGIRIMLEQQQIEYFLSGCGVLCPKSFPDIEHEESTPFSKCKRIHFSDFEYPYSLLSHPLAKGLLLSEDLLQQLALMKIHTIGDLVNYTSQGGFERFYKEEPIEEYLIQELIEKMVDCGFYTVKLSSPLEKYLNKEE